jgi:hypothetical protein
MDPTGSFFGSASPGTFLNFESASTGTEHLRAISQDAELRFAVSAELYASWNRLKAEKNFSSTQLATFLIQR